VTVSELVWCSGCSEYVEATGASCNTCGGPLMSDDHHSGCRGRAGKRPPKPRPTRDPLARLCRRCGEMKRLPPRSDNPDKLRPYCADCAKKVGQEWRKKNWARAKARGTWRGMINRCHQPGHGRNCGPGVPRYDDYGGKGISVMRRWRGPRGFHNFVSDIGLPPSKDSTLDRINCKKNYTRSNCRWANKKTQDQNRQNTHWVTATDPESGEELTLCVSEWARRTGVQRRTIGKRLALGWDANDAISWDPLEPGKLYLTIKAEAEEVPF